MSVPLPVMGEKGGLKLHKGMHGVDEVDQAGVNMVVVKGGKNLEAKQVGCVNRVTVYDNNYPL